MKISQLIEFGQAGRAPLCRITIEAEGPTIRELQAALVSLQQDPGPLVVAVDKMNTLADSKDLIQ